MLENEIRCIACTWTTLTLHKHILLVVSNAHFGHKLILGPSYFEANTCSTLAQFYCFAWSTLRRNFAQRYRTVRVLFYRRASHEHCHETGVNWRWLVHGARSKIRCSGFGSVGGFSRHVRLLRRNISKYLITNGTRTADASKHVSHKFWCSLFHDHDAAHTHDSHITLKWPHPPKIICSVVKSAIHSVLIGIISVHRDSQSKCKCRRKWFLF